MPDGNLIYKDDPSGGDAGDIVRLQDNVIVPINQPQDGVEQWKPVAVDGTHVITTIRSTSGDDNSDDLYLYDTATGTKTRLTGVRAKFPVPDWFPTISQNVSGQRYLAWATKNTSNQDTIAVAALTKDYHIGSRISLPSKLLPAGSNADPSWGRDGNLYFCNQPPGAAAYRLIFRIVSPLGHKPHIEEIYDTGSDTIDALAPLYVSTS
jgi:hypothetical protein